MSPVLIQTDACIGCGSCARDCVAGCLSLQDGKAVFAGSGCISCGHSYAICPVEAISLPDAETDGGTPVPMSSLDSSTLLQAMKSRRSIRHFLPTPVEPEKLEMILEAGRYSPTGSNSQDIAYTILGSRQEEIEKICVELFRKSAGAAGLVSDFMKRMQIDDHFFFKGAPLVIVVSSRSRVDAGLASSYMELMAESLGLGVLYSGFFVGCTAMSGKLKKLLDLPHGHKAVTCMVIGYHNINYKRIPGRKKANVRTL